MKNKTSLMISAAMLFSIIWSLSCAHSASLGTPTLENRTLRISREFAGFEYQYEVCVRTILGICSKKEMKKDTYDLNDPVVREKLINMGFVARIREKL